MLFLMFLFVMYAIYMHFFCCLGSYTDCTPDELMSLVQEIEEKTKLVKTHVHHLVSYKNTFVGQELVEWLVSSKGHSKFDSYDCSLVTEFPS